MKFSELPVPFVKKASGKKLNTHQVHILRALRKTAQHRSMSKTALCNTCHISEKRYGSHWNNALWELYSRKLIIIVEVEGGQLQGWTHHCFYITGAGKRLLIASEQAAVSLYHAEQSVIYRREAREQRKLVK